jgi:uncharacterized membrane protein
MVRGLQPALAFFAVGLVGLGVLALVYGDFALVWQPVPAWIPGRTALAYASGVLMLLCGAGLFLSATVAWSVRILFPYLILWTLLKTPDVFAAPAVEGSWLGLGELMMMFAGGWMLFARFAELRAGSAFAFATGDKAMSVARGLFGVWLVPIGLSHFFYTQGTIGLIPEWIPFRTGWAYLTGAGHIAAGLALLFSVIPGIAAAAEAGMLSAITLLVWVPANVSQPNSRLNHTAFFISWLFTAAAWVVAQSTPVRARVTAAASARMQEKYIPH